MQNVLLIDKEAGWTSHDVVAYIRKQLAVNSKQKANDELSNFTKASLDKQMTKSARLRVGHAGTLDPFATGLLIILVGKEATKRQAEFMKLDKEYEATLELGKISTTGDIEGIIISHKKVQPFQGEEKVEPLKEAIESVLKSFLGEIEHVPHKYSAIKVNGKKAYELARAGEEVKLKSRKVTIYDLELIEYNWPFLKIKVKCSSGTYIRSLAEDIGKSLGAGAYLTQLRRIKIGEYSVEKAKKVGEIGNQYYE